MLAALLDAVGVVTMVVTQLSSQRTRTHQLPFESIEKNPQGKSPFSLKWLDQPGEVDNMLTAQY